MGDKLDEINERVGSSFEKPDFEHVGYKFFFREYLPSFDNPALVGCALAWKDRHSPYFYAVAGSDEIGEYKQGAKFKLEPLPFFRPDAPMSEFVAAKLDALERLKTFVEGHA